MHARQYRLPGDRRRGGRNGRVHPRGNGFPRENQGYVTHSRRRVRVVHFYFFSFSFPLFFHAYRDGLFNFPFYIPFHSLSTFPTHGRSFEYLAKYIANVKKIHIFQSSEIIFQNDSMIYNGYKLISFEREMFEVIREVIRETLRSTEVCYFLMRCDERHSRCVTCSWLFLRAIAK